MIYKRPTSFSQNEMFETCPRSWHYKYIQKIPVVESLEYAHRGKVLHETLEAFYPDKKNSIEELKKIFNNLWAHYKMDDTFLKNKKDETWLMVLNGINLDLHVTSTELKIWFPDVVAYLDVVNTRDKIILDWKSSTRSPENEASYAKQVKFYAWLYHRKFGELPSSVGVRYLKYPGSKMELDLSPSVDDIKEMERWHNNIRKKMEHYIQNSDKLPDFNTDYFFSPYKHLWGIKDKNPEDVMTFVLDIKGNNIYIKGNMPQFLEGHIDRKFSYELKDSFFIKQRYPNANTRVRFWNRKTKSLPIGFKKDILKTLHDFAEFKKKIPVITVNDMRNFNDDVVKMPDRLLSGKTLRDYQLNAVESFIASDKISFLELTTGSGKTLCSVEIIRRLGMKTLFVVDKKELLYQAKEVIEENLGFDVGIIGDGKKDIKDVTVATIQTLTRNIDEFSAYLSSVRFLIVDEAHKIATKSYFKLGQHMKNTEYRLSMTATAFRDDKNDMMMQATGGNICYSLKGQELIEKGYLMKPDIFFINVNNEDEDIKRMKSDASSGLINETPSYARYYKSFIVNNERRNNIVKKICENNPDKTILILVKLIEHGELLEKLIPGSLYIHGDTKQDIRMKALADLKDGTRKVLISTISIFSEGVDIPSLSLLIQAAAQTGKIKTIQALGRILRKYKGKDCAKCFDFMDSESFFKKASISRIRAFKKEGHSTHIISKDF